VHKIELSSMHYAQNLFGGFGGFVQSHLEMRTIIWQKQARVEQISKALSATVR
jgi:hypothetical protein